MKLRMRNIEKTGWLVGVCFTLLQGLTAQSPFDPGFSEEAAEIREKLEVFADRSVYVTEERIRFRVDRILTGNHQAGEWSTVFYAELVGSNGQVVARGKYPLKGDRGGGSLLIPSGTLTGNYYLCCYTRWMRNFGSVEFSYLPVKIVDPIHAGVIENDPAAEHGTEALQPQFSTGKLNCRIQEARVAPGEEVKLSISLDRAAGQDVINGCVTVVPPGSIDTLSGQMEFRPMEVQDRWQLQYLPDLGAGPALSGTVTDPEGRPVREATLHFALLGSHPDLFSATTDTEGRFIVAGPQGRGSSEYFVTPDPALEAEQMIHIDQEYAGEPFPGRASEFRLTEQERETATRMAIRRQLSGAFEEGGGPGAGPVEADTLIFPFYGTDVQRINLDEFVALPTVEEVFINLVPNVDIQLRKEGNRFMVRNLLSPVEFYTPLVMVDDIPVFDHQAVFDLDPRSIERIDVINQVYIKGEVVYGGVINLISRERNLAGIDLPPRSYFFDFSSFESTVPFPERTGEGARTPDLRNTFFWLDELELHAGREERLTFSAPREQGTYLVLVRATAPGGEVLSATCRFSVGPNP